MRTALLDTLATQMPFVLQFEARDVGKRLAAAMAVCGVMAYFGLTHIATQSLAMILLTEVAVRLQVLRMRRGEDTFDRRTVLVPLSALVLNATAYCLPAIHLIQADRPAANIAAFIWLGGFLVHAAGVHSLIRVWNWLAIAPPALCTVLVAYLYGSSGSGALADWDHAVLWVSAVLMVANTIEVVIRQHDNRNAFAEAQIAAAERLDRLEYMARHDQLTGLLNRRAFDEVLSDGLLMASDTPVAVLMIDLDGFKPVNDTYGHAAGDAILVELAERLRSSVAVGRIARVGGDEFGIICDGSDRDAVEKLAIHVRDICVQPMEYQGARLSVGASVGIAISGPDDNLKTVCARADRAMYSAKSSRLSHPVFDSSDLARTG